MEITVSVDDQLAERARRYAESHGTSVDQMVREYLAQVTESMAQDAKAEADELVRLFQQAKGNSGGWKFNREEIYEERMKWRRELWEVDEDALELGRERAALRVAGVEWHGGL